MDLTVFFTIIGTGIAVIATNISLMSWMKSDVQEIKSDMKSFESEIRGWRNELQQESKDFHGRLCSLESRYHQEDIKQKEK